MLQGTQRICVVWPSWHFFCDMPSLAQALKPWTWASRVAAIYLILPLLFLPQQLGLVFSLLLFWTSLEGDPLQPLQTHDSLVYWTIIVKCLQFMRSSGLKYCLFLSYNPLFLIVQACCADQCDSSSIGWPVIFLVLINNIK